MGKQKTKDRTERFNAPFAALKKDLRGKVAPGPAPGPPPPPAPEPPPTVDDATLFAQAVGPVAPLPGARAPTVAARRKTRSAPAPAALCEELEVMARLAELVGDQGLLETKFTDEYIEGFAPELSPSLADKLREGEFPIQEYIDLHGLSAEEARLAVERFFDRSRVGGLRSVLVVHGRGLGSSGGEPVLKPALARWLTSRRLRRQVLGFCSARQVDGGPGAVYVLLTRWTPPHGP